MVGRGSSAYERELRTLLEGDAPAVRGYARSLPPEHRSSFERLIEQPYLVIRGAGSLGFDLVALRREFAFPLEVKASSEPVIRFTAASGRADAQLAAHRAAVGRVGLTVLYAYRRLGLRGEESWRVFLASPPPEYGVLKFLCRRLPPVSATREGHGILRWEEGMPLSRFLEQVRFLTERPVTVSA
ncbi:MAG TPA: Holliday junction resolvase [Thermoplasmata archaeon]|nr:Holliday junction resolvase [Thermoplasmata archaeon]